ncbi:hypothetical protein AX769_10060 [Frondihabitans sp. PAMC 28766]|uniref:MFS transporter n=1 Tax=Frondihabitans sp. PAMC 28766 TaxID=1795630 RepID=UPI00078CD126|nr:MFS transporter [Frondihabitans sp. PAMC 28766]AMM20431.1 hypothetical protein AX769_10060 [Frondihabitans sp. PAMC 28766]
MTTTTPPRTTYGSVFAATGYTGVYLSTTLAMLGASFQMLVFSVSVFAATHSPAASSIAFAAGFLPQVVGGALLTSLADRFPPRLLIVTGAVVRFVVAVLLATGALGLVGSVAVVAAAAMVAPLFSAANSGLVSRLLDGDRYVLGRSLFTITSMISQLVGIAAGGVVLQILSTREAFAIVAGLQLAGVVVGIVGLPRLAASASAVGPAAASRWHLGDTLIGYATLMRVPIVRTLLLLWWTPLALMVGAESLAVAYAGEAHANGATTAILIGSVPLGALVGELIVGRLCSPATRERLVFPLLGLLGVAVLPLALNPPVPVAAVLLGVASMGLAYELGRQTAFRDALPAGREGLGFGLLGVGMMTGQGIGPLIAGPLATGFGVGPTMAVMGALVLVAALVFRPMVRRAERPFRLSDPSAFEA